MRLWHTKLITVLPQKQLVAQWRELSAIAGSIQKNGTPNHMLVNFVLDYDFDHFISYAFEIRKEMTKRNMKTMDSAWDKIVSLKPNYQLIELKDIYRRKMNYEYFCICYYNLLEKVTCNSSLTEDEKDNYRDTLAEAFYESIDLYQEAFEEAIKETVKKGIENIAKKIAPNS